MLLLSATMVMAATFTWEPGEYMTGVIQIPERPAYEYDNNVSVSETLVSYSTDAGDLGFPYMEIDNAWGNITVQIPTDYLSEQESRLTNPLHIIAENGSDEFDTIVTTFRFNVTNVNDAPDVTAYAPALAIAIDELESQGFNLSYYDIDPTDDDLNVTWSIDNVDQIVDDNDSYSNYTFQSNYSSAGSYEVKAIVADEYAAETNVTWTLTVNNINRNPYFNTTNSSPALSLGYVTIQENQSAYLAANYSDPDQAYPGPNELYEIDASWYVDGILNRTVLAMNYSNLTFSTDYLSVLPPNQSQVYNITLIITDGSLTNTTTWLVNVSNVNRPPIIESMYLYNDTWLNGSIIDLPEGRSTFTGFSYSDIDNNVAATHIYVDDILANETNQTTIQWNFTSIGLHTIRYVVNDTGGLNDTGVLFVNITDNTAPQILSFSVVNSTGGTAYSEGDILNITFQQQDNEDNIDAIQVFLNGTFIGQTNITVVQLNYSNRGTYNISVLVNDTENLTATVYNDTITVGAVEIEPSIYLVYYDNGTQTSVSEGGVATTHEGTDVNITFFASDQNGNNTLTSPQVIIDGSNYTGYNYTWSVGFSDAGEHPINLTVNDTSGRQDSFSFIINVTDNLAPIIGGFQVLNSTGGTNYSESDQLDIAFTCTDTNGNALNKRILLNGTIIYQTTATLGSYATSYALNATSRGSYNVSVFCDDTQGLSDTDNLTIQVLGTEEAPYIESVTFTNNLTGPAIAVTAGQTITIEENTLQNITATVADHNGNQTIATTLIRFNGTLKNISAGRTVYFINTSDFSSQGWYNISIEVNDTSGLENSTQFFLHVLDNIAPNIHNITITNSTGGIFYKENTTINISINVSDVNSNIDTIQISRNGTSIGTGTNATVFFDFGDGGWYNISAIVNDTEGLTGYFERIIFINTTFRPPVISNISIDGTYLDENDAYASHEGSILTFNITASDPDNDLLNVSTYRNGTLINDTTFFLWDSTGQAGMWNITAIATDAQGLTDTYRINLTIFQNVPPTILSINITNSTGGNESLFEGDMLNITTAITDTNANADSQYIMINGSIVSFATSHVKILNYTDRGWYNISVFANDTLGANITSSRLVYVTATERNPVIDEMRIDGVPLGAPGVTIDRNEGASILISFTASDENGNATLSTYNITRNGTLIALSHTGTWNTNYDSQGIWNITGRAIDSTGRVGSFSFFIDIANNTAPIIDTFTIENSTGGNESFIEGGNITIHANATDTLDNINNITIQRNGTTLCFNASSSCTHLWNVNYTAGGDYAIRVIVNDAEGLQAIEQRNITITSSEVPPMIISAVAHNGSAIVVSEGMNITIHENTYFNISFAAQDDNNNIDVYNIITDGITRATAAYWEWTTNFSSEGDHGITLRVNDTTGLVDTYNLTLRVINNTAPQIIATSVTNSTGGTAFSEGDSLNVAFSYRDNESNQETRQIWWDGLLHNISNTTSIALNYSDRGSHNLTFFINDTEGLFARLENISISISAVERAPTIDLVTITYQGNPTTITEGAVINMTENSSISIVFNASDENGNGTLHVPQIMLDTSLLATSYTTSWYANFTSAGVHQINLSINDTSGAEDTFSFLLNVSDNLAPAIDVFSMVNSTGGNQSFSEGDSVTIFVNATDTFDNIENTTILRNGTILCFNASNSCTYAWSLNHTSRGIYNITAIIADEEGLTVSSSQSLTITANEIAPVIDTIVILSDQQGILGPSDGATLIFEEGDTLDMDFTATDINGNDTIDTYNIRYYKKVPPFIESNTGESSRTWVIPFTAAGSYAYIFEAYDTTLLKGNASITINITDNVAPHILQLNITNSTGGTSYSENATINITFTASDNNSNLASSTVSVDGTIIASGNTTHYFGYNTAGQHNITVMVNDTEGLQATQNTTITVSLQNIAPVIYQAEIGTEANGTLQATEGSSINIVEGEEVQVRFLVNDTNGNNTLDTIAVYIDGGLAQASNTHTFTLPSNNLQQQNISLFVNDTGGLHDRFNFSIIPTDNRAPQLFTIDVTNSTGGSTYVVGDNITISINASDVDNNLVNYSITVNNTLVANTQNTTYALPGASAGNLTINASVQDRENLSNSSSHIIVVRFVNIAPQITNATVAGESVSEGEVVLEHFEGDTVILAFNATDSNGNETINDTRIIIAGPSFNTTINTTRYAWSIASTAGGKTFNVSYFVSDDEGANDTYTFKIRPGNVKTTTQTVSSGGGGGGGGSAPPIPPRLADVDIEEPDPITLGDNQSIIQEIVLRNTGGRTLTNLTLQSLVDRPGVRVEILEHNRTVEANGTIRVRVRITNEFGEGAFKVTLDAKGDGGAAQLMTDNAFIHINAKGKGAAAREQYNSSYAYVNQLLRDNVECLEITDTLREAERLAAAGDYKQAQEMLLQAKEDCLSRTRKQEGSFAAHLLKPKTGIDKIIIYTILILLAVILLPSIYVIFRYFKSKKIKVDKKEEKIERFLKEFYE
jgi:hypothetical protein